MIYRRGERHFIREDSDAEENADVGKIQSFYGGKVRKDQAQVTPWST